MKLRFQEENDMKVFYLSWNNFGCVIYANNEVEAFEEMKIKRETLFNLLDLPRDIKMWCIEEFTPDLYDGCLCFY